MGLFSIRRYFLMAFCCKPCCLCCFFVCHRTISSLQDKFAVAVTNGLCKFSIVFMALDAFRNFTTARAGKKRSMPCAFQFESIIYEHGRIKNVWRMCVSPKFDKHINLFDDFGVKNIKHSFTSITYLRRATAEQHRR